MNKKNKRKTKTKGFKSLQGQDVARISTGFAELDRVLGGGIVKDSLHYLEESLE